MFSRSVPYYDLIYAARGKDYKRESELVHTLIKRNLLNEEEVRIIEGIHADAHRQHGAEVQVIARSFPFSTGGVGEG